MFPIRPEALIRPTKITQISLASLTLYLSPVILSLQIALCLFADICLMFLSHASVLLATGENALNNRQCKQADLQTAQHRGSKYM